MHVLMDHIYKNPKTLYEKFVNAYCRYERRFCAREDLVKTALVKWNEMKSDKAAVEQYISAAPEARGVNSILATDGGDRRS